LFDLWVDLIWIKDIRICGAAKRSYFEQNCRRHFVVRRCVRRLTTHCAPRVACCGGLFGHDGL
jgi:hypothetical protein